MSFRSRQDHIERPGAAVPVELDLEMSCGPCRIDLLSKTSNAKLAIRRTSCVEGPERFPYDFPRGLSYG